MGFVLQVHRRTRSISISHRSSVRIDASGPYKAILPVHPISEPTVDRVGAGGSSISNTGMFVAEMSSNSCQLLGMAERGMLLEFFSKRSHYGTPLIGIMFSTFGVLLLSWLSFQEIVAAENFHSILECYWSLWHS